MTPRDPRTRVGDADREQTVAALQRYVTDGYLTLDEFSDRSAAAYRATTHSELAAVSEDLTPDTGPGRTREDTIRIGDPRTWSPVVIVATALVGVLLLAAAAMAAMMLGMMSGMYMGDMGDMGGTGTR